MSDEEHDRDGGNRRKRARAAEGAHAAAWGDPQAATTQTTRLPQHLATSPTSNGDAPPTPAAVLAVSGEVEPSPTTASPHHAAAGAVLDGGGSGGGGGSSGSGSGGGRDLLLVPFPAQFSASLRYSSQKSTWSPSVRDKILEVELNREQCKALRGGAGVDRDALRRAVHARDAYFVQYAESLTMTAARQQGLTRVHFLAQPEPFLSLELYETTQ